MKIISKYLWEILGALVLILVVLGFFYFETSTILRVLVVILGLLSLMAIRSASEILALLIFYLGLYDFYNIRYGLAVPLFLIILTVFGLTIFTFSLWIHFQKLSQRQDKNILWLYGITTGLIAMEIFLTMSFWPVEPKVKSLVIVVVFYIISRIFYLYINNVLNSKKIVVFILISLLILGAVLAFNLFFGF
ncbi:MAG: hypothetical protein M1429_00820 [Patescibacteria group bacterium]|nr:hypothetical protein [Patescibacteria group bacterium]